MSEETKVCPNCGYDPFTFVDPKREHSPEITHCQYCGDKLVLRAELPRDIWKDPQVKEALKDGRQSWDVACLRCPECGELGYYNEGSTFSCRFCDLNFLVVSECEEAPQGYRTVSADDVLRLDDTVTECDDGYHNHTL